MREWIQATQEVARTETARSLALHALSDAAKSLAKRIAPSDMKVGEASSTPNGSSSKTSPVAPSSGSMPWSMTWGGLGYASLPVPVTADALGAPYPRARVFVVARRVADANGDVQPAQPVDAEVARAPEATRMAARAREAPNADSVGLRDKPRRASRSRGKAPPVGPRHSWSAPMPSVVGVVPGATGKMARRAAGNCVIPACAEVVGWVIRELMAPEPA